MSLTRMKRNLAKQTEKANNLKAKLEEIVDNRKELRETNSKLAGQVESLKSSVEMLSKEKAILAEEVLWVRNQLARLTEIEATVKP
jgi:predicted nuclease with TOPRIM domain